MAVATRSARIASASREIDEWRRKCPLRLWMERHGKGKKGLIQKIMKQAGVTHRQSVYAWLYGYQMPRNRAIFRLRPLTGITLDAWLRWFDAFPAPTTEETETCIEQSNESPTP